MRPAYFVNYTLLLFLSLFSLLTTSTVLAEAAYDIDIRLHDESSATVYDFIIPDSEFIARDFNHTSPQLQAQYDTHVQKMKSLHTYSFEDPLFILNPYGTVTNGLYVHFEADEIMDVNYTITTDGQSGEHTFQRTAKNASDNVNEFESQLIGLVPGELNHVEMELTDQDGAVLTAYQFDIQMPKTVSFYPSYITKTDGDSTVPISDGLFYLVGTSQFGDFTYFFDNAGVLRAEIETDSYRFDNLLFHEDEIIVSNTSTQLVAMNALGKITTHYDLSGYNLHHDFIHGRKGEILILASIWDGEAIRREDIVLSLELNTGKVTEVLDLQAILGDYMALTTPTYDTAGDAIDLDWIHINSIEKIDQNSVVLSSRETSTIIKISDLYTEPHLDYLIGPEAVWTGTEYSELLLEPIGDIPMQGGQHSLNYSTTPLLGEGKYYLTFYNNNYWRYLTRPDYQGRIEEINSQNFEPNSNDSSYLYKYLIDEGAETFELVQSFEVPYSSIVSNVDQQTNSNYVINSGKANVVGEYDSQGNLIASYDYVSGNFTYRVLKDDFNGFWFKQ